MNILLHPKEPTYERTLALAILLLIFPLHNGVRQFHGKSAIYNYQTDSYR